MQWTGFSINNVVNILEYVQTQSNMVGVWFQADMQSFMRSEVLVTS